MYFVFLKVRNIFLFCSLKIKSLYAIPIIRHFYIIVENFSNLDVPRSAPGFLLNSCSGAQYLASYEIRRYAHRQRKSVSVRGNESFIFIVYRCASYSLCWAVTCCSRLWCAYFGTCTSWLVSAGRSADSSPLMRQSTI